MDTVEANYGPLPIVAGLGLEKFSIVIYALSASISLLTFLYGLAVLYIRPQLWQSSIFRVVLVAQIINCLRFIIRPIAVYVRVQSGFGCRSLLFLNNVTAILPVNLCIYCVIYLQLVVIHKVPPTKRWPRVVLITLGVAISVVPTFTIMVLPPSAAGISSFCNLQEYAGHTQYIFLVYTVVIWEYLPGIVGIISVSIIVVHIIRTKRETKKAMRTSSQFYGTTRAVHLQSHPDMLNQSLRNIIWFPITPIVSLWLNAALISVHYYTGRSFRWLEFVNVVLLGLQSVLLAIALFVNPSVRYVMIEHLRKQRRIRREKRMSQSDRNAFYEHPEYGLPRIDSISSISSSFSTLNSLSDTTASDL